MPHPVSLSKSKLMSYVQCARRLWLEQYSPELEEGSAEIDARLATGQLVGEAARKIFGRSGGLRIDSERGLRSAIEQTSEAIALGGDTPIFEASFDYEGLVTQIDVFNRSGAAPDLIEVKASSQLKDVQIQDCAIQAWVLQELGVTLNSVCIAHINTEFIYQGDGDYRELLTVVDVTSQVGERLPTIPKIVDGAREVLQSLDEPEVLVGEQCKTGYTCPFFEHCSPSQGRYPVSGLRGSKAQTFQWIHQGFKDLRDVPEQDLTTATQKLIWDQTTKEQAYVGAELSAFVSQLGYPRYFLDFETISFAIPVWAQTRPYEVLPFQWSCHEAQRSEGGDHELVHKEFLDVSGEPPMRACAERLIDALGTSGAIFVYTHYEKTVIDGLAKRFEDLAPLLSAITNRLVDLYPVAKESYYHPDMLGSWSIQALLPTSAPELNYDGLDAVQDGRAAQKAYLKAIEPNTSEARRQALVADLLDYCRQDSLALVKLLEFFVASAER